MTEKDNEEPEATADISGSEAQATDKQAIWVGETATIRGGINLDTDNVIGIFGKAPDLRVILRRRDGSTLKVKVGDAALGGRVLGIDENSVVIVKNGKVVRLRMPNPALDRLSRLIQ